MEVKNDNTIIKVDNRIFVQDIGARPLLETLAAMVECAIETGQFKKLVVNNLALLTQIASEERDKLKEQADDSISKLKDMLDEDITDRGSW